MNCKTVDEYLSFRNISYRLSGNKQEVAIDCLFCEDSKKHLYINNFEGCFHCKKCDTRGSWKNFLENLGETEFIQLGDKNSKNILYKANLKKGQKFLDRSLADKYHSQLPLRIMNYLKSEKRGLKEETIKKFKIGWNQAITIPIFDENNNLVNIRYRLDPDKTGDQKYWNTTGYGEARLFNISVLKKVKDCVVVAEGEFDAMVLDQNGIPAVSGTCGARTFKEEWAKYFKEIKTVYLCYDTDKEGKEGAEKTASILNRKVKIINLPHKKDKKIDITEYFATHSVDDFKKLMDSAEKFILKDKKQKNIDSILGFSIKFKNLKKLALEKDKLKYILYSINGYKIDLAVYKKGQILNRDSFFITSSKSRATFCKNCRKIDEKLKALIANHLIEIIEVLGQLARKKIKQNKKSKIKKLTKQEKRDAKKLLQSPTLLFDILQFVKKLGVAGEEKTSLTHYIVFTSRITDEPLSEIAKGESSAGKSFLISQIMRMFPKDAYINITDASAQSFYYAPKDYFAHKTIVIFETHGGEKTDYSIRSLLTEKKLKLQVTVKDPKTGQFFTTEKEVLGPTNFISTSTRARLHSENETRLLSIYPDESRQQTKKILEISDLKYRGILGPAKEEIKKWQNVQKILKPYPVIIPFVEEVRKVFPKEPLRVRRDYSKFLCLLSVVALLHQEQREKKKINKETYLIATLADFYITKILFEKTLQKTIYEIPPKSEYLIKKVKELVSGLLESFSIRELADKVAWDYDTTWKWLKPIYQKGFLIKTEEHIGSKPAKYKPTNKKNEDREILPDTVQLYKKNKQWLGKAKIYNPITGKVLEFRKLNSTDVPIDLEET